MDNKKSKSYIEAMIAAIDYLGSHDNLTNTEFRNAIGEFADEIATELNGRHALTVISAKEIRINVDKNKLPAILTEYDGLLKSYEAAATAADLDRRFKESAIRSAKITRYIAIASLLLSVLAMTSLPQRLFQAIGF